MSTLTAAQTKGLEELRESVEEMIDTRKNHKGTVMVYGVELESKGDDPNNDGVQLHPPSGNHFYFTRTKNGLRISAGGPWMDLHEISFKSGQEPTYSCSGDPRSTPPLALLNEVVKDAITAMS